MVANVIVVNPQDNVAVALVEIKAGQKLEGLPGREITARANIPRNHKAAIVNISRGAPVIKYGEPIGLAGETIQPGDWVHTHNLKAEG